ncbi:MAG: DMT family transporter [Desulfobacterales bacterium]|nr:DMT family transporter [Desulfobacterales bacterium]
MTHKQTHTMDRVEKSACIGGEMSQSILLILVATLGIVLMNTCAKVGSVAHGPIEMVFYFLLIGVLVSGPYTIWVGKIPDMRLLPWMIGIGVFAAVQQLAKTTAYQLSEASLLAPYTYTAIVWATLTGWILWQDLPTVPVVIGTAVVIGCNLYILLKERC